MQRYTVRQDKSDRNLYRLYYNGNSKSIISLRLDKMVDYLQKFTRQSITADDLIRGVVSSSGYVIIVD
jgi:hypothetical protein